jgi:hypothetical protein
MLRKLLSMRYFRSRLPLAYVATTLLVITVLGTSTSMADMNEVITQLLTVCQATGSATQLETSGNGEVSLTLKALRSGNLGAGGGLTAKYTKSDWQGLQGGLSAGMSQLQADQADKVRACLAPYMPGIVQAILQSK